MALFGDKKLKEENSQLKRQLDVLSTKVKRFEKNIQTGVFLVGKDANLKAEADRLQIQDKDIKSFYATCKKVTDSKKSGNYTYHDKDGNRFDCEINYEESGVNIVKRDNTMLEGIMGPHLVEKLLSQGRRIGDLSKVLKPEMVKVTVCFIDLRSFTSFAESSSLDKVADFLADFYRIMRQGIYDHGGIVDKFLGDGLMALFGAPFPLKKQERQAVKAGLAVISAWNAHLAGGDLPAVGVGIATGKCIVGNIGATRSLNYTALGDTVNTAARLVSTPTNAIWADGATVSACARDFSWKKLEPMQLKGKSAKIDVHELSG